MSKTISFRLRGRPLAELVRQADSLGVSPGELGRAIVERHLTRDDTQAILDAIDGHGHRLEALAETLSHLEDDLSELRNDFNRGVLAESAAAPQAPTTERQGALRLSRTDASRNRARPRRP